MGLRTSYPLGPGLREEPLLGCGRCRLCRNGCGTGNDLCGQKLLRLSIERRKALDDIDQAVGLEESENLLENLPLLVNSRIAVLQLLRH